MHVHTWVSVVLLCPTLRFSCYFPEALIRPVDILKYGCVSLISVAMLKYLMKSNIRRKGLVLPTIPG